MLTLRYFPCRGRGAALRLFLADRGFQWVNETVPLSAAWLEVKANRALSGVMGTLPTLELPLGPGQPPLILNETMAIAAVLAQQPEGGSPALPDWSASLQLASKLFLDVVNPYIAVLWAPIRMPGVDVRVPAKALRDVTAATLDRVESGLFCDGRKYAIGNDTSVGDYFLFETIDR